MCFSTDYCSRVTSLDWQRQPSRQRTIPNYFTMLIGECVRIGQTIVPKEARHVYAKLRRRKSYAERLQDAIDRYKLDIVWFMAVSAVPLRVPFIATVWDLEHRKQPYFPEVSVTGWTWEEREQTYRAVLPRASFIITGTQVGKEEITHYYGVNPSNVKVVPFPVAHKELGKVSLDVAAVLGKIQNQRRLPALSRAVLAA